MAPQFVGLIGTFLSWLCLFTRYQTKIDEICNVCDKRFRVKGKSRREQLLEFVSRVQAELHFALILTLVCGSLMACGNLPGRYTGAEIVALLQRGNIIVTSRDRCDEHIELMKKHSDIRDTLAHWHKSVMSVRVGIVSC